MYGVNDTILYGAYGVCKITAIQEKDMDGSNREYYVLKPIYDDASTIFLPVDNEKAAEKMRRVLSADEIHLLIQTMPDENTIWIENENKRKEEYKNILMNNDRSALIRLIKTLYIRRREQMEKGKKLHVLDERFMNQAEKLLYEEFAHVLDLKREQVIPFICEQVDEFGEIYMNTNETLN